MTLSRSKWPQAITRRGFLRATGGASVLAAARSLAGPESERVPQRPADHPLSPFDREMEGFMAARKVPGGALAVVKDRHLLYARGYGWADRTREEPVRPESLFRIASLSKPITAVAILRLVEAGELDLDDKVFEVVKAEPFLAPGKAADTRLANITLRHVLQHTGGWDRDQSFDPMFRPVEIAETLGTPKPAGTAEIIRYMLGQPLDFDPGSRYAYSNFGYCVLGRVIERVTGLRYERWVQEQILTPIGLRPMRIGASLAGGRAPGEVRYYTAKKADARNVFSGEPKEVPWPYGGFCLEAMDAHGGWLASSVHLARFAAALDGPEQSPLLKPATFQTMYAPPPPPVSRNPDGSPRSHYYGCGWLVRAAGLPGRANYWHTGSLPGTFALLVRRWDGLSWAALFNQRSEDQQRPDGAIDSALHRAAAAVTAWPKADLFPKFFPEAKKE